LRHSWKIIQRNCFEKEVLLSKLFYFVFVKEQNINNKLLVFQCNTSLLAVGFECGDHDNKNSASEAYCQGTSTGWLSLVNRSCTKGSFFLGQHLK